MRFKTNNKCINVLLLIVFGYFFILMLQLTLRYIPYRSDIYFLQIKQTEINTIPYYEWFMIVHIFSAIFTLLAGFTQFNNTLLKHYPIWHRRLGRVYVWVVLGLAAPSGFVIGCYANGGIIAIIFFTTLAVLWWWFTFLGIRYAIKGNIKLHRNFMIRSFALALSAITLRLWKVILVQVLPWSPMDIYILISGLGWLPNLIFAEIIIRNSKNYKK